MAPKTETSPAVLEPQVDPDEIPADLAEDMTPEQIAWVKEIAKGCRLLREQNPELEARMDAHIMMECERGRM